MTPSPKTLQEREVVEKRRGATCDAVRDHLLEGRGPVEVQTQYAEDQQLGFNGTWAYRNGAQVSEIIRTHI